MWPNFYEHIVIYCLIHERQFIFVLIIFYEYNKIPVSWNLYSREEKKINSKWVIKLRDLSDSDMYHAEKWIKKGGNEVETEAPIWNRMIKEGLTKKVSFEQDPNS